MTLLERLFGAPAVDALFTPAATVQRMLAFEAALADAEARVGVIPASAARLIAEHCRVERIDLDALAAGAERAGNLAIPLVHQLTALVASADAQAASYVHWGATSQDTIDTALALQLRDALALICADLEELQEVLRQLADRHRATPIVARTWMQHAVPTTFGLEVAGWVDALARHQERLTEVRRRDIALQLGGAGGTLVALEGRGLEVATGMAEALELPLPRLPWHAHRDRVAAVATMLGLLTGTVGKVARDLALQAQAEIAELAEPTVPGRGGSSSMPHKRNPLAAAVALAAAVRVPGLVSSVLGGMVQEHERGLGGWQAEWETIPQIVRLAAGALHHVHGAATGLSVDVTRMTANLEITGGLVYSESVTLALARAIGRPAARTAVEAAAEIAVREHRHLRDVLAADRAIRQHLSDAEITQLFTPAPHVTAAEVLADRVLESGTRRRAGGHDGRR